MKIRKIIMNTLVHPVTMLNLTMVGFLGMIELVHIRAHHSLDVDVHGHVHRALKENPELARSACYELD